MVVAVTALRRWFPPPSPRAVVGIIVAVAFLAGIVGWKVAQPRRPATSSAEIGFLYDMIDHHMQAIGLSAAEMRNGRSPGVRVFAEEIHRFQSYEIGLMERMLIERGHTRYDVPSRAMAWMGNSFPRDAMPGMASPAEIDGIEGAGEDTDAWFVALMVDHHAGGAAMAARADELIDDRAVSELAARMAKVQRQEISEMLAAARRAGIVTMPPRGVTWDVYGHDGMDMDHDG